MEFWPIGIHRFGSRPEHCLNLLLDRGFSLFELRKQGIEPVDPVELLAECSIESQRFANLICTRQKRQWDDVNESWLEQLDGGWWKKMKQMVQQLTELIPPAATFILVDDGKFGDQNHFPDRRVLPFMERDGVFYGPPRDDRAAHDELQRLINSGATFLVFSWPAFWWLDYYAELARFVRATFSCVLEDERLIVFDLKSQAKKSRETDAPVVAGER